jgi:hypothetical protein
MMKPLLTLFGIHFLALSAFCADTTTQNKNITILSGSAPSEAKSDVRERLLEECIVSLPKAAELVPVVSSDARFLKEINGEAGRNDFVKTYSAIIDINYMLYQKVMLIVSTNAMPAREPIMKEMEKNLRQTRRFESTPGSGDIFAGRSQREYYFSSPETAIADARKKAEAWLGQQTAVICKPHSQTK